MIHQSFDIYLATECVGCCLLLDPSNSVFCPEIIRSDGTPAAEFVKFGLYVVLVDFVQDRS